MPRTAAVSHSSAGIDAQPEMDRNLNACTVRIPRKISAVPCSPNSNESSNVSYGSHRLEAEFATYNARYTIGTDANGWLGSAHSRVPMHEIEWHAASLHITMVNVQAATFARAHYAGRGRTHAWQLGRLGLAFATLLLPLLGTDRGRALLAGTLSRALPSARRPRALVSGGRPGPGLPAGPA